MTFSFPYVVLSFFLSGFELQTCPVKSTNNVISKHQSNRDYFEESSEIMSVIHHEATKNLIMAGVSWTANAFAHNEFSLEKLFKFPNFCVAYRIYD